ncbi:DUF4136 domain-containing protein [Sediminibacterium sp.]|uniref:DUF4136 domain-containing protein n=1 Tax=Sediminibacterium sp. TaxID=1917865 RepID=UPI0027158B92|nr:DUF4136 domain-containing protein [Sediminibacterium sp.]MDO8997761.1 DUF4136 domain-containing protein [Sediminibacterium sp.]MDP1972201.1 DUF4136 domain-containing protein [Sediminibacterium sp.]MDP2421587.1 DUF4136 domain-containing protein [Sediminibacterium sp.]
MKQLFIILFSTSLFACASPKVLDVSTAPEANFSQYKTFAFYEVTALGDTITEGFNDKVGYIKKAITAEMEQRQFKQVNNNADLLINIGIAIKLEVQTRETDWRTDGMMKYMGQRNYKWESKEIEVGRYRRGAFTLHLIDAAKNHMLWTATLRGSLPDDSTKLAAFANKSVQALFSKFPVQ